MSEPYPTPASVKGTSSPTNPYWQAAMDLGAVFGGDIADRPVFRAINKVVRTVDIVRTLRSAVRQRSHALGGGYMRTLRDAGLVPYGSSNTLDDLIAKYAVNVTSKVIYTDADDRLVRVGLDVGDLVLLLSPDDVTRVRNMFVREDTRAVTLKAIGDMIWRAERRSALAIQARRVGLGGDPRFSLQPIVEPGDYASSDTGAATLLDETAKRCQAFRAAGRSRHILLHGPPGTGKTTLARQLASRLDGRLVQLPIRALSTLSAQNTAQLLQVLQPDVLLLDDIDRDSAVFSDMMELLTDVGGWPMVVVGTTNTITTLDPALLRPGRFDETIQVDEPSMEYRETIVRYYLGRLNLDMDAAKLAQDMREFAPADIREVLHVVSAVGPSVYGAEVSRVGRQRELHANGAVQRWMTTQ